MNKKWSKKKKITVAIIIVAVLALLAAVLYITFKPEDPIKTQIVDVTSGDITETFDTTAIVQSANQGNFAIFDGVVVESVNVRVGDSIKKGDVLATFDTTSLNTVLNEKRTAYNTALDAYNDYLDNSYAASQQLTQLEQQAADLENEIIALEAIVAQEKEDSQNGAAQETPAGDVDAAELEELKTALKELLGDNALADRIIERLLAENGSVTQMISAIKSILSAASFDMSSLSSMSMSANEQLLLEKELQLVQVKVQAAALAAQSNDTLKDVYKTISDSAYESYELLAEQVNALNAGWIAEEDGFVREVNIKAGETITSANSTTPSLDISSILASVTSGDYDIASILASFADQSKKGMVVEYYPLEAKFEISKHDISKIYMDQKVTVTTADGKEFSATVNYISAVAEGSAGGLDINSIMGSASGASNTLTAKVVIEDADRSVIIGLDVDITAKLETKKNVLLIPVESIQYDNETGFYVFKYDEENKIVVKTPVVVGISDDTYYEVVEGLTASDKIVRAPTMTMKDGQSAVPAEK